MVGAVLDKRTEHACRLAVVRCQLGLLLFILYNSWLIFIGLRAGKPYEQQ